MKNTMKSLEYTNEEFKQSLENYLVSKKKKQEKRGQMHWFFRRLCVDPRYEAKVDFVERVLEKIDVLAEDDINTTDRDKTRSLRHLVQSGLEGRQGFEYTVIQVGTSRLYQALIQKNETFQEERRSYSTVSKHCL